MQAKQNVLVTGGRGFVGRHVVDHLAASGHKVRSLDILDVDPAGHRPTVEQIQGDVRSAADIEAAMNGVTQVVHCAALVPVSRAGRAFWEVNVDGTRLVLEAALRHGVRKVVHVSSSAVYGVRPKAVITEESPIEPYGDYGRSKAEAENLCKEFRQHGLDITIIRPRTVLGPGRLGILEILFERIRKGRTFFVLGSGKNRFQLVSVFDLVQAITLALMKDCRNEDFNIGAREFRTLREDLEALARRARTGSRIRSLPATPVRWGLRILGALHLSPFVGYHYEIVGRSFAYDTTKAEARLGWKARDSNEDMLAESYQWYLQRKEANNTQSSSPHSSGVGSFLGDVLKR